MGDLADLLYIYKQQWTLMIFIFSCVIDMASLKETA